MMKSLPNVVVVVMLTASRATVFRKMTHIALASRCESKEIP